MKRPRSLPFRTLCALFVLSLSSPLLANDFPVPDDIRIEGERLLWEPVAGAGGYNIYLNNGYLTTVRNRTDFRLQVDGLYQVVAFDESASRFSRQTGPDTGATYEVGASQSETNALGLSVVKVVSVTCRDVGPGESCTASCRLPDDSVVRVATGGACSTSDIVEADASASPFSYSCAVPTFSGEVRAQAYCIDVERIR